MIPMKKSLAVLLVLPLLAWACTESSAPVASPSAGHEKHDEEAHDWCAEHGLPESMCTRCNPSLVARFVEAGDYCRDHGYPQSACPICKATSPFPVPGLVVRLASARTAEEAGIETAQAARRPFGASIEVVGTIAFDPNARADLAAPDPAIIERVHVDLGDRVEKGDPLITLRSSAVGAQRADLDAARTAHATANERLARERRLYEKGLGARADLEAAERAEADARAALRSARSALQIAGSGNATGSWTLRAPLAGAVIERRGTAGSLVAAGETLIAVADPARLRAELAIPEAHAPDVRPGQQVVLELAGGRTLLAQLDAVGAVVDPRTRTVSARASLDGSDGSLKGGAFVRARIATGAPREEVVIPRSAVQQVEGKSIVFVQEGPATFRPVAVSLGAASGDAVSIARGLRGGEQVVTTGSFLLATETRRDAIGAGCCEVP